MLKVVLYAAALTGLLALTGCEASQRQPTGAQKESQATKQLQDQAAVAIGMPAIKNFTEKELLKTLYELRDKPNLITYTYTQTINGAFVQVCPGASVGYGIPFSAQFTAPAVDEIAAGNSNAGYTAITKYQPEPNGIYMPDSTSATWVICQVNGELSPVYVEPQIVVSRFKR